MKYKESVSRFHPIAALSGLPNISVCSCLVKSPNTPTPDEQQTDFRFVATSLNLRIPTRLVWYVERTAAIHHSAVMMVTLAGHCCHPVYCTQTGAKLQGDHSIHHCRLSWSLASPLAPQPQGENSPFFKPSTLDIAQLFTISPGSLEPGNPAPQCPAKNGQTLNSMLQTCCRNMQ